ncbi:MAG: hypothetical protein ACOH17_07120 [Cellulomonas sp.]
MEHDIAVLAGADAEFGRAAGRGLGALIATELAVGGALVIAPHQVLATVGAPDPSAVTVAVARVLGVRLLGQAAAAAWRPRRDTLIVLAGVDSLHAASMVALLVVDRGVRRPALASALTATAMGGAALLLARSRS